MWSLKLKNIKGDENENKKYRLFIRSSLKSLKYDDAFKIELL